MSSCRVNAPCLILLTIVNVQVLIIVIPIIQKVSITDNHLKTKRKLLGTYLIPIL